MPRAGDSKRTPAPPTTDAEPRVEESSDAVDDTLILWFLGLTPMERLQWAQDMADAVTELRGSREF